MEAFTNKQLTKIVRGFQEIIDRQGREIEAQRIRLELAEGSLRRLMNEITNAKQMFAHVSGRGMGSTVHKD
jgi:hypothetical protein